MENDEIKKGTSGKAAFIVSIIVFFAVLIACMFYLIKCTPFFAKNGAPSVSEEAESVSEPVYPADTTDVTGSGGETESLLPENPVNFSKEMKINDDIYAWLYIPNTNVNYPILQSREDDLYYLRRDIYRDYDISGVLFTQSHNRRDFSDPVTVIYGHNMTEYGTMFATLHNFENEDFFKDNDTFYIYTPGHILTYKIVSAYKYDNRHIMNSFDFGDPEVVKEYFDYVLHPTMIPMNVREDAELKEDDKLVVLSTCMADNTFRYLVNGVLVKDEKTK